MLNYVTKLRNKGKEVRSSCHLLAERGAGKLPVIKNVPFVSMTRGNNMTLFQRTESKKNMDDFHYDKTSIAVQRKNDSGILFLRKRSSYLKNLDKVVNNIKQNIMFNLIISNIRTELFRISNNRRNEERKHLLGTVESHEILRADKKSKILPTILCIEDINSTSDDVHVVGNGKATRCLFVETEARAIKQSEYFIKSYVERLRKQGIRKVSIEFVDKLNAIQEKMTLDLEKMTNIVYVNRLERTYRIEGFSREIKKSRNKVGIEDRRDLLLENKHDQLLNFTRDRDKLGSDNIHQTDLRRSDSDKSLGKNPRLEQNFEEDRLSKDKTSTADNNTRHINVSTMDNKSPAKEIVVLKDKAVSDCVSLETNKNKVDENITEVQKREYPETKSEIEETSENVKLKLFPFPPNNLTRKTTEKRLSFETNTTNSENSSNNGMLDSNKDNDRALGEQRKNIMSWRNLESSSLDVNSLFKWGRRERDLYRAKRGEEANGGNRFKGLIRQEKRNIITTFPFHVKKGEGCSNLRMHRGGNEYRDKNGNENKNKRRAKGAQRLLFSSLVGSRYTNMMMGSSCAIKRYGLNAFARLGFRGMNDILAETENQNYLVNKLFRQYSGKSHIEYALEDSISYVFGINKHKLLLSVTRNVLSEGVQFFKLSKVSKYALSNKMNTLEDFVEEVMGEMILNGDLGKRGNSEMDTLEDNIMRLRYIINSEKDEKLGVNIKSTENRKQLEEANDLWVKFVSMYENGNSGIKNKTNGKTSLCDKNYESINSDAWEYISQLIFEEEVNFFKDVYYNANKRDSDTEDFAFNSIRVKSDSIYYRDPVLRSVRCKSRLLNRKYISYTGKLSPWTKMSLFQKNRGKRRD